MYVTPKTQYAGALLMAEQRERTGFESITPGQFVRIGSQAVYIGGISDDQQTLTQVFIAQSSVGESNLALAQRGYQQITDETRSRFLVLEKGHRYELPQADLTTTDLQFQRYALRMGVYQSPSVQQQVGVMTTTELLNSDLSQAKVELQWRLGLPMMVLVMVFIALPLTKVNPRQGRFMAILPVLLLQMLFLGGLMSLQGTVNKGQLPLWPGLWLVHGFFLAAGLLLCWRKGVFVK